MKPLFFIFSILAISEISLGQVRTCSSLHVGVFKLTNEHSGTTIIKRTKNTQEEENSHLGVKITYYVNWINECTYELRAKKIIKGNPILAGEKEEVITVRIMEIKTNSYIVETSANFTNSVVEREIEIIK